jgi:hypothetical protein
MEKGLCKTAEKEISHGGVPRQARSRSSSVCDGVRRNHASALRFAIHVIAEDFFTLVINRALVLVFTQQRQRDMNKRNDSRVTLSSSQNALSFFSLTFPR